LERVNVILNHPVFTRSLMRLSELEADRVFCRHGIEHLLDVARIAHILNLESEKKAFPKDLVYAAALLHDIGRARQYEDGTPHEKESADLAKIILSDCGFDESESKIIIDAILLHRTSNKGEKTVFAEHIFRADKFSRRCCDCVKFNECSWELKNGWVEY